MHISTCLLYIYIYIYPILPNPPRYKARGLVSLKGGLEGLRRILTAQLDEVTGEVRSLVDQLVEPARAKEIRKLRWTLMEGSVVILIGYFRLYFGIVSSLF